MMNRRGIITCLFVLCLSTMAASACAFAVSGTISGSAGPIADATVTIYSGNTLLATFTTLSDGLYTFDVAAGNYTVRAAKTNYQSPAPLAVTVVDADVPGQNIILAELYTISGTVALSDAASPAGATVTLIGDVSSSTSTTLADGSYSFKAIAGSYTVRAWKPFYTMETGDAVVGPDATVPVITLQRVATLTISGSISDGSGPVSGTKVRATCSVDPKTYYDSAESVGGAYTIEVPDDWLNPNGYKLSIPHVPFGKKVATAPLDIVYPVLGAGVTDQNFTLATLQRLIDVTSDDFIASGPRGTLTAWQNHGTLGGYFTPFGGGTTSFDVTDGLHAAKFIGTSSLRLRDTSVTPNTNILMPAANTGNAPWTVSTWARQALYVAGSAQAYFIWAPTSPAAPLPQDHIAAACNWSDSGSQGAFRNAGTPQALGYADLSWAIPTGSTAHVPPSTNVWHNITLTYDGAVISVFVDGVLNNSKTLAGPIAIAAEQPINIGSRYTTITATGGDQNFYGSIARIVMYDGATDPADVPMLAASIKPADALMHTITVADPGPAGTITPGTMTLPDGDSQTFTIAANLGYAIQNVVVDGVNKGAITNVSFTNVVADHSISATFTVVPLGTITGTVKDKTGNPIVGATVYYSGTPNASFSTAPTVTTGTGGTYTLTGVPQGTVYVAVTAAGYWNSSDRAVSLGATPAVANFTLASTTRTIPTSTSLLFSCVTDTFPSTNGAATGNWANYLPTEAQAPPVPAPLGPFTMMASPTVQYVDNIKWEQNQNIVGNGDGFVVMGPITNTAAAPQTIPCNGATIVVVARPNRDTSMTNYGSLVNIFRQNLVLGIQNSTGRVYAWRNASNPNNSVAASLTDAIPNGQKTILSMVVQPTGAYKVYANGQQIMDVNSTLQNAYGAFTAFVPNQQGPESTKKYINIGRSNGDTDRYFNGNIGDVFVYKTALSDTDRQTLESDLKDKFGIITHTITATAGANGTISPAGAVIVTDTANRPFTITPAAGYEVSQLLVDGSPVPVATSYTFNNVVADHTIDVTFRPLPAIAISIPSAATTSGSPVSYVVSYTNVDGAITLTNANVTLNATGTATGTVTVSGSGLTERTVTIDGITGEGTLGISIAAGTASNAPGTLVPAAGPSETFAVLPPSTPVANLAELKAKAGTGETVKLTGIVTVTCIGDGLFFVGEESYKGCIKVVGTDTVIAGYYVTDLTGIVTVDSFGQYTITLSSPVVSAATGNTIKLVGANNKAALTDTKLRTNLVKVWGNVVAGTGVDYAITDGYASPIGVHIGIALPPTGVTAVTGILWQEATGIVLYQTP